MNNNEAIRILVTGGTFDKEYDMIHGKLHFEETHVPEMLQLGRCRLDIEVRTIMMIDSLNKVQSLKLLLHTVQTRCLKRVLI